MLLIDSEEMRATCTQVIMNLFARAYHGGQLAAVMRELEGIDFWRPPIGEHPGYRVELLHSIAQTLLPEHSEFTVHETGPCQPEIVIHHLG